MYPEIEGLVVDTKELTWTNVDRNNPEEMRRMAELELDRAAERIHAAVKRLRELGIIDEHGNRINKELPPDMREDAERDFGG
jgi:hypothetical protein